MDPNIQVSKMSSVSDDNNNKSFLDQFVLMVNHDEVEQIDNVQKNMLNRFEKTNEMLVNCNALGNIHFETLSKQYRQHTAKLNEMHKDLDWIFHRIRLLKQKLNSKYPNIAQNELPSSNDNETKDD